MSEPERPGDAQTPLAAEPTGGAPPAQLPIEPVAPAELVRTPGPRERFAWYFGTAAVVSVLVFFGLRLDAADLNAPFYYDMDSLLILPMVKATAERGFGGHWRNERLGAPGIQELHDFPVVDHLHFLVIWGLSAVVSNVVFLYNLYYLLTFPITALTAMVAFRHLGLTLPAAAVGGLLYAFLPFHYQRWENHYFLSAYWMIPLALLPVLDLTRGRLPLFRRGPDGSQVLDLFSWRALRLVVLMLATASAGAYYAFFTCALLAFAGLYGAVAGRSVRPLVSAGGVIGLLFAFGILNHVPTYLYHAQYGKHTITTRYPEEADYYGLKVAHVILPIEDHNLTAFNRLKWLYNSSVRPAETENRSATFGAVATLGFLGLLASTVLPVPRPWPYGSLAALTVFSVLLAITGGFGAVFNLMVTAQIRAHNRISVFTAFLCLFAVLWALDRLWATHPKGLPVRYAAGFGAAALAVFTLGVVFLDTGARAVLLGLCAVLWVGPPLVYLVARLRNPAAVERARDRFNARVLPAWAAPVSWAVVAAVGFVDQTPHSWFRPAIIDTLNEQAARFRDDAVFFQNIEKLMAAGAAPAPAQVFCLPYLPFPEMPPLYRMQCYEHSRGYVHTGGLHWSFGALKGREADSWQQDVSQLPTDEFLRRIVFRGFDGLLVDRRGYATAKEGNRAATIVATVHHLYASLAGKPGLQLPEVIHPDREQFFLDLRPYRDLLRQRLTNPPFDYETYARKERELPSLLWLHGIHRTVDDHGVHFALKWGTYDATAWFVNPTDRTRTFKVQMVFGTEEHGTFHLRLSGLISDEFDLSRRGEGWDTKKFGVPRTFTVEVPPGRHRIDIRCTPPAGFVPSDVRKVCYYVLGVKIDEQ